MKVKKCNSDNGNAEVVVVSWPSEFGGVFVDPVGVDPVGVEPVGVELVGPPVGPVGVEPVGVDPFGVELSGVELKGGESVGVMVVEVDNDDAVIVEPVNVDKVVSNVDIVAVGISVEPIESPLLPSSLEPSSPPGIRRTHKIISKVNKSIKMTTRIIMFLVLLSFTKQIIVMYPNCLGVLGQAFSY